MTQPGISDERIERGIHEIFQRKGGHAQTVQPLLRFIKGLIQEDRAARWVSVEEFEKTGYKGWVWIHYKGSVRKCWYDRIYLFRPDALGCYMAECINAVQTIPEPQPPGEEV